MVQTASIADDVALWRAAPEWCASRAAVAIRVNKTVPSGLMFKVSRTCKPAQASCPPLWSLRLVLVLNLAVGVEVEIENLTESVIVIVAVVVVRVLGVVRFWMMVLACRSYSCAHREQTKRAGVQRQCLLQRAVVTEAALSLETSVSVTVPETTTWIGRRQA